MSAEIVFPLRGFEKHSMGNCFIDKDGFVHTVDHIFQPLSHNAKRRPAEGGVKLDKYITYGLIFSPISGIDYAVSQDTIPEEYRSPNVLLFASSLPKNCFKVIIKCAYPYAREIHGNAFVASIRNKGHKEHAVIFLSVEKPIITGNSGSPVLYLQPAISGRYSSQRHAEERILGTVVTESTAEISPRVLGL